MPFSASYPNFAAFVSPPAQAGLYNAAFMNAPNIFLLFASVLYENSGCHCTAQTKLFSGIYAASVRPSGEKAIAFKAGASFLTA